MAARCEAAGRRHNEDNFQLNDNLSVDEWSFITGKEIELGEKGVLLVVCDGMGGMSAGDVASAHAVKTIKEWFTADRLTPQVMASSVTMIEYIEQAIIAADENIKEAGRQNDEYKGMGSTIVLAWIVDNRVFIGWCGDSRAYRFNPATGLERLSHDHSYVQEMVDSGKLSKELAFDHPDTNIITRSLGDARQQSQPDVKCYAIFNDDIILLCSDGLHGVLRDVQIEQIFANNSDTIENCRNALWTESEKVGWTDNVTVALCKIISEDKQPKEPIIVLPPPVETAKVETDKRKLTGFWIAAVVLLLLGIAFGIGYYAVKGLKNLSKTETVSNSNEAVISETATGDTKSVPKNDSPNPKKESEVNPISVNPVVNKDNPPPSQPATNAKGTQTSNNDKNIENPPKNTVSEPQQVEENKQSTAAISSENVSTNTPKPALSSTQRFEYEMELVQAGTFTMGNADVQGNLSEKPAHKVTVSGFYIGKYEVTQGQWEAIMGNNPSFFAKGGTYPVENVSWNDIQVFIRSLNTLTKKSYRLPTEAEWEYAAFGGNKRENYRYSGSGKLDNAAWHTGNSNGSTHQVGTKQPNKLGLYDMSGNVWEWCSDWFGLYPDSAQTDPKGPASGSQRVARGGSWKFNCQNTFRISDNPDNHNNSIGFRLALSL